MIFNTLFDTVVKNIHYIVMKFTQSLFTVLRGRVKINDPMFMFR